MIRLNIDSEIFRPSHHGAHHPRTLRSGGGARGLKGPYHGVEGAIKGALKGRFGSEKPYTLT